MKDQHLWIKDRTVALDVAVPLSESNFAKSWSFWKEFSEQWIYGVGCPEVHVGPQNCSWVKG